MENQHFDQNDKLISRREFLKGAAAVGGAAVASVVVAACSPQPTAAPASNTPAGAAPTTAPAVIKPKSGGKVTWALSQDPVNLIPFGAISTSNQWGKEMMYDSLVEWDKDLIVRPALAEKWENPNDKTWIWTLRKGVKFHNGDEVTADDVKYSIDLQRTPPPPGIVIAQYPAATLENVEVVDKYTVKFNMKGPDPTVLGYLAWARYSAIIPKGMYDKANLVTSGIGTGPFKLVEYIANDRVVYTRNKDFWKPGVPYLDDLTYKVLPDENSAVAALRSGAIDGCTIGPDAARNLKNDPNITLLKGIYSAPRQLQLTIKGDGKPWNKKAVRQAMNKAINRQDIIDKVYAGEAVLTGPITTGYGDWFIPPEELAAKFYKPDLPGAIQLMKDAGFANGFEITLYAISNNPSTPIAEIIKEQLKQIGIDVKVVSEEIAPFAKRNGDGTFDFCSTGRGMRHDPTGFINEYGRPTVGAAATWFNKGDGWKNDEAIALYDKAAVNLDSKTRHEQVRRIQEIALDEFPHFTLCQDYKFIAVRKQLQDMYVSFTDFYTGLRAVWLA